MEASLTGDEVFASFKKEGSIKNVPAKVITSEIKEKSNSDSLDSTRVDELKKDGNVDDNSVLLDKIKQLQERLDKQTAYGRAQSGQKKEIIKLLKKSQDEGLIDDEIAESLYQVDKKSYEEVLAQESLQHESNPLQDLFNADVSKELANIARYTDEEEVKYAMAAFKAFFMEEDEQEVATLCEELEELSPLQRARKIISIGKAYHEEIYKEIKEAKGIKNFKKKLASEIDKYKAQTEKLKKQLSLYEGHSSPTYKLDEINVEPLSSDKNIRAADLFDSWKGKNK